MTGVPDGVGAPPGAVRRGLIGFAVANVVSLAIVFVLYQLVLRGEFMQPAFAACHRFFTDHEALAVLAATMPFFASCLVGFGYARRASRRRAAAELERARHE